MSKGRELPLAPFYRILRKGGAPRVSHEAAVMLRDLLEDIAMEVARESWVLAQHAKRRTVTADDVSLAAKRVLRQVGIEYSRQGLASA